MGIDGTKSKAEEALNMVWSLQDEIEQPDTIDREFVSCVLDQLENILLMPDIKKAINDANG